METATGSRLEDRMIKHPRPSTWIVAIAALLVMALAAAGCGSSNDNSSSSATTAAITKAEFLKKSNAICKKGNQQINAQGKKLFTKKKPTQAQLKKFSTTVLIPSIQGQIDGIRALGAPKGDEAQVKAIVDSAQSALDKGKNDPTALTSSSNNLFAQTNKLANAYGLTVCGSGG